MIRVGDKIRPKKNLDPNLLTGLLEHNTFPIKVKSIHSCPTKRDQNFPDCEGCPGYINSPHKCFGNGIYMVEAVETDWDE